MNKFIEALYNEIRSKNPEISTRTDDIFEKLIKEISYYNEKKLLDINRDTLRELFIESRQLNDQSVNRMFCIEQELNRIVTPSRKDLPLNRQLLNSKYELEQCLNDLENLSRELEYHILRCK